MVTIMTKESGLGNATPEMNHDQTSSIEVCDTTDEACLGITAISPKKKSQFKKKELL